MESDFNLHLIPVTVIKLIGFNCDTLEAYKNDHFGAERNC